MKQWYRGALAMSLGLAACSGRYEVGGVNGGGGNATEAGSGAIPTAGSSTGEVSSGAGGGGNAGPSMPAMDCVPPGMPKALTGDFATPEVVWSRISPLVWGEQVPPPSNLPARTTPSWVGQVVTQAFMQATASPPSGAQGARKFVAQLLDPGSDLTSLPEFRGRWELLLAAEIPALSSLLNSSLGDEKRLGVFTEPSFLKRYTSISTRGAVVSTALFVPPPTPPAGVTNGDPNPSLSDRDALAVLLANPVCSACHRLIDPLAYPLGSFDARGNYREMDHGAPIDTSGTVEFMNTHFSYQGLIDFNDQMALSCDANLGLADNFLRFAMSIDGVADNSNLDVFSTNNERIRQAFYRSGRSYPDLVRAYAQSPLGLRP